MKEIKKNGCHIFPEQNIIDMMRDTRKERVDGRRAVAQGCSCTLGRYTTVSIKNCHITTAPGL